MVARKSFPDERHQIGNAKTRKSGKMTREKKRAEHHAENAEPSADQNEAELQQPERRFRTKSSVRRSGC